MNSSYSRRKAEELILNGRVFVNDEKVVEMGTLVDPLKDKVEINGETLQKESKKIYLMLNKPSGYISTRADQHAEKTVMELIKEKNVYPVGRLDKETEGLMLFTNDGDFAYKLTHPKFEQEKEYLVSLRYLLTKEKEENLQKGVMLDDKKTAPSKVKFIGEENNLKIYSITIHEGRKREIRRMFDAIFSPVIYLKRIRISNIHLGDLKKGEVRPLTIDEIKSV